MMERGFIMDGSAQFAFSSLAWLRIVLKTAMGVAAEHSEDAENAVGKGFRFPTWIGTHWVRPWRFQVCPPNPCFSAPSAATRIAVSRIILSTPDL
jgi:hypothetical protein